MCQRARHCEGETQRTLSLTHQSCPGGSGRQASKASLVPQWIDPWSLDGTRRRVTTGSSSSTMRTVGRNAGQAAAAEERNQGTPWAWIEAESLKAGFVPRTRAYVCVCVSAPHSSALSLSLLHRAPQHHENRPPMHDRELQLHLHAGQPPLQGPPVESPHALCQSAARQVSIPDAPPPRSVGWSVGGLCAESQ